MKKFGLMIAVLALVAGAALAVTPQRETKTIALGAATFTNNENFVVWKPLLIEAVGLQPASNNVTVLLVQDGITNTLGAFSALSSVASLAPTSTVYVFKSGEIRVTGAGTNAGTIRMTREVYP